MTDIVEDIKGIELFFYKYDKGICTFKGYYNKYFDVFVSSLYKFSELDMPIYASNFSNIEQIYLVHK